MKSILKKNLYLLLMLPALLSVANSDVAADPANSTEAKIPNPWSGEIKIGGVFNSGNSDSKNLHAKLAAAYKAPQWNNAFSLEAQLNHANKATSAANLRASAYIGYLLGETDYVFFKSDAVFDRFAIFNRAFKEAVGYGRYLVETPTTKLTLEAGPGANHSHVTGQGRYIHQIIFNIGSDFSYKITEYSTLKHKLDTNLGREYSKIRSESALKTKITDALAFELAFTVTHDTKIPENSKNKHKTDTVTKISIVYNL